MLSLLPHPHRSLFWTQPVDAASDFVIEDPLAFDYLSQQVGYWLFGGLTTRTSRAQYFAVVLYGLWLVDTELAKHQLGADDAQRKLLFERWERLWALAVFEHRGGDFEIGDPDAVRGQRGAARTWKAGTGDLPLDYKLIGRQSELGGLGAYVSALRDENTGLVFSGSFKPTSLAQPIIDAFWEEAHQDSKSWAYEAFARLALDPAQKRVPRKHGLITLRRLGERSRLTVLVENQRTAQQDRLWRVLFEQSKDDTLRFAQLVRDASRVELHEPREILVNALSGKFGTFEPRQRDKLEIALAFGDVQRELLSAFNRAFAESLRSNLRADFGLAAEAAINDNLRAACKRLMDAAWVTEIQKLPMHGKELVQLVTRISSANKADALMDLVLYHTRIHKERRHAKPWLRMHDGRLVIDVCGYSNRADDEGHFPALKLDVVRRLLNDLGRLS